MRGGFIWQRENIYLGDMFSQQTKRLWLYLLHCAIRSHTFGTICKCVLYHLSIHPSIHFFTLYVLFCHPSKEIFIRMEIEQIWYLIKHMKKTKYCESDWHHFRTVPKDQRQRKDATVWATITRLASSKFIQGYGKISPRHVIILKRSG